MEARSCVIEKHEYTEVRRPYANSLIKRIPRSSLHAMYQLIQNSHYLVSRYSEAVKAQVCNWSKA